MRLRQQFGTSISKNSKILFRGISGHRFAELAIGEGSIVQARITADRDGARVLIGQNTFIGGSHLVCADRIEIGNDVLISWGCTIVDHDSHALHWSERSKDVRDWYVGHKDWTHVNVSAVSIENRCWLGFNVAVLKGVKIGEGAVVAACSVVTRDVPPGVLVAGNPARIVRTLESR